MADTSVALLNLLPGVPLAGTLSAGATATATADGLSFTALLSTQLTQVGTSATASEDLLDLETTPEDPTEATVANPLALLLGGVLQQPPLTPIPTVPAETVTATQAILPGVTSQLPETTIGITPRVAADASRTESLRFAGPANPLIPADPTEHNTPDASPVVPTSPAPNTYRTPPQTVVPTPTNTSPAAVDPTQAPPLSRVVVPQAPIVSDRSQLLPAPPVELRPVPVQPPVSEPEPVAGLTPVMADQPSAVSRQQFNVVPHAVPPAVAEFPITMKQVSAPIVAPVTAGEPQTLPIDPDVIPATVGGQVIRSPRQSSGSDEMEWRASTSADGTQVIDSSRVQQHTTPVPTTSSAMPERGVADARSTSSPVDQIGDTWITHADVRSRNGEHEFHIRLDPPELGEVRVRVHSSADGVRAELTVANDAVRAMIESQIPELRQRLQDGGVSVSQFDVTTNTSGGDSSARNPDRDSNPREPRPEIAVGPAAKPGRAREPTSPVGGLLDVTA